MVKSEKMRFYCYSGWRELRPEGFLRLIEGLRDGQEKSVGGRVRDDLPFFVSLFIQKFHISKYRSSI